MRKKKVPVKGGITGKNTIQRTPIYEGGPKQEIHKAFLRLKGFVVLSGL